QERRLHAEVPWNVPAPQVFGSKTLGDDLVAKRKNDSPECDKRRRSEKETSKTVPNRDHERPSEEPKPDRTGPYDDPHRRPACDFEGVMVSRGKMLSSRLPAQRGGRLSEIVSVWPLWAA